MPSPEFFLDQHLPGGGRSPSASRKSDTGADPWAASASRGSALPRACSARLDSTRTASAHAPQAPSAAASGRAARPRPGTGDMPAISSVICFQVQFFSRLMSSNFSVSSSRFMIRPPARNLAHHGIRCSRGGSRLAARDPPARGPELQRRHSARPLATGPGDRRASGSGLGHTRRRRATWHRSWCARFSVVDSARCASTERCRMFDRANGRMIAAIKHLRDRSL